MRSLKAYIELSHRLGQKQNLWPNEKTPARQLLYKVETMRWQTHALMKGSIALSEDVFGGFIGSLGAPAARHILPSR